MNYYVNLINGDELIFNNKLINLNKHLIIIKVIEIKGKFHCINMQINAISFNLFNLIK